MWFDKYCDKMRINVIMWWTLWVLWYIKTIAAIFSLPFTYLFIYLFLRRAWLDFVSRSKSLVTPQMRRVVMGERKTCLDTCRSFCWCTGDEVEFLARLSCHGVKCKQLCHDLTLYNRYYVMLMAFSLRCNYNSAKRLIGTFEGLLLKYIHIPTSLFQYCNPAPALTGERASERKKGLRQRVFWETSDQKIMCRCQDSHIFVFSLCF